MQENLSPRLSQRENEPNGFAGSEEEDDRGGRRFVSRPHSTNGDDEATATPESIINQPPQDFSSSRIRCVRPATHCGSPRGVPLSRRLMTAPPPPPPFLCLHLEGGNSSFVSEFRGSQDSNSNHRYTKYGVLKDAGLLSKGGPKENPFDL